MLSLNLCLKLFSFTLKASLLLLKGFLSSCLFCFVFGTIGFTHFGELGFASDLFLLSLALSVSFFFRESESGGLKLTHPGQLLLLLLFTKLVLL